MCKYHSLTYIRPIYVLTFLTSYYHKLMDATFAQELASALFKAYVSVYLPTGIILMLTSNL